MCFATTSIKMKKPDDGFKKLNMIYKAEENKIHSYGKYFYICKWITFLS